MRILTRSLKTLAAAGLIALSGPVLAHSSLMQSHPQHGAMMMEPVSELNLHFGAPVRLINLELVNSTDSEVALEFKPSLEPATEFKVPVPALKSDQYRVNWTIMGNDGHKMKGHIEFMQH